MSEPTIIEPQPGLEVGRIVIEMHLENASDLTQVALGLLPANQVRSLTLEALVDTDSLFVSLPPSAIAFLGLRPVRQDWRRTASGRAAPQIYSAVRITVQERECVMEVAEVADGAPAGLGRAALALMDFWIDITNGRLAGNPEHGGQWMIDSYLAESA